MCCSGAESSDVTVSIDQVNTWKAGPLAPAKRNDSLISLRVVCSRAHACDGGPADHPERLAILGRSQAWPSAEQTRFSSGETGDRSSTGNSATGPVSTFHPQRSARPHGRRLEFVNSLQRRPRKDLLSRRLPSSLHCRCRKHRPNCHSCRSPQHRRSPVRSGLCERFQPDHTSAPDADSTRNGIGTHPAASLGSYRMSRSLPDRVFVREAVADIQSRSLHNPSFRLS